MRYRLLLVLLFIFAALGVVSTALAQSSLQTFTSRDGTVTLQYPQGWTVNETQRQIDLTTNPSVPTNGLDVLEPGQAAFSLILIGEASISTVPGFNTSNTPVENLQAIVSPLKVGSQSLVTLDEVTPLTIGEHPAASVSGIYNRTHNDTEFMLIDFENGGYGLIIAQTAPGDLARVEPKMRTIAASITYTPATPPSPTTINLVALIPVSVTNASKVTLLSSFTAHTGITNSVAISPDGKTIASAGDDGGIYLWDAATGEKKTSPAVQDGGVVMVQYTPDGKSLISAADDGTIIVWNAETGEQEKMVQEDGAIWYIATSPDSKTLAFISYVQPKTGLESSTVWLWDLSKDAPETIELYPRDFFANSLSFSPDGQELLYSAGVNRQIIVKMYDVRRQAEAARWTEQGSPIDVFFTADGVPHLSKTADNQSYDVQLVNLQSNSIALTLTGHQDSTFQTILNSTRTILGTPSYDDTTKLWDIQTGDLLASLPHHDRAIGIAFSTDGRLLVTSDNAGTIYVWGVSANT